MERRVVQQEEQLGAPVRPARHRRERELQGRDRVLGERERGLVGRGGRLGSALDEQRRKLEEIAGLTAERGQAPAHRRRSRSRPAGRPQLLGMRLEEEARETAHMKAKEVLATTIQRLAPDYTVETTVSIVDLPSDDMKGRIIGREGRNIRALEAATGVDLIVDDTPEAVIISGFDPFRREIARLALQRLIADGRIHPARIEEVVEKVKEEIEQHMQARKASKACFELGVHGLHPELVKLLGRLKFRTSYGQNLPAALEGSGLAGRHHGRPSSGSTCKLAKRAGLLHDIGKALDQRDGGHATPSIGAAACSRKYGESPEVIHAIAAHHERRGARDGRGRAGRRRRRALGRAPGRAARDAGDLRQAAGRSSRRSRSPSRASEVASPSRPAASCGS